MKKIVETMTPSEQHALAAGELCQDDGTGLCVTCRVALGESCRECGCHGYHERECAELKQVFSLPDRLRVWAAEEQSQAEEEGSRPNIMLRAAAAIEELEKAPGFVLAAADQEVAKIKKKCDAKDNALRYCRSAIAAWLRYSETADAEHRADLRYDLVAAQAQAEAALDQRLDKRKGD